MRWFCCGLRLSLSHSTQQLLVQRPPLSSARTGNPNAVDVMVTTLASAIRVTFLFLFLLIQHCLGDIRRLSQGRFYQVSFRCHRPYAFIFGLAEPDYTDKSG